MRAQLSPTIQADHPIEGIAGHISFKLVAIIYQSANNSLRRRRDSSRATCADPILLALANP
jgi:hypothetical protein